MTDIFFYGSLRDPGLLEIVVGRRVSEDEIDRAVAPGFATRRIAREAYPVLVPMAGRSAEGLLFQGASLSDMERLAFFEEAEYGLEPITVEVDGTPREALYFRGTEKAVETDADWDFEAWRANDRTVALFAARELMTHYGHLPVEDIDTIWPGIMNRARQRARALAEEPAHGRDGLRTAFSAGDVEWLSRETAYTSYLAVEEARLRHRRFDGGWSEPIQRSVVLWGDAVTLLPYDPERDAVLLIEQFRAALAARGDRLPWCLEVVAGRIDQDGTEEATARREAREEAGLSPGRMEEIARYYSTSGLAGEQIVAFVAEADLSDEGGLHGKAEEGEDIRAMVLSFGDAMRAVADGAVNSGPALVSLLWLAVHRERLRREWR